MRSKPSFVGLAVCAVGLIFALGACSANEPSTVLATSIATSTLDSCDQAAISTSVQNFYATTAAAESTGLALQSVSSVECAGDWAIAKIVVGDSQGHNIPDFEVAKFVDGAWAVADRMTVCGTWNPKKPAQIPNDAQIDARLYSAACAAA